MNRELQKQSKVSQNENALIEGRIKLLGREESKMQKKIDQTRRLAEKIERAKEFSEAKLEQMKKLDFDRDQELQNKRERIQEERLRRNEAIKLAQNQVTVKMIQGAIAAKEEKIMYADLTAQIKDKQDRELKEKAD